MATPAVAIVTSTFNPDQRILERCLNAIAELDHSGFEIEYCLVDNNSSPPISSLEYVRAFLADCPWAKLIEEPIPGASFGKMRGVRETSAPLVIFFDDDNEPEKNYVMAALDYARRHPNVGAFGPGDVRVEYIDDVDEWLDDYKYIFQEDTKTEELHSCITSEFQAYYPIGTGLVMKRESAAAYADRLENGELKITCRKGGSLSSGGDMQMVYINLKMGYEAGTSPSLKLRHLISGKKANRPYIRRLTYGCAVSTVQARLEVFPEETDIYRAQIISGAKATLVLGWLFVKNLFSKDLDLRLIEQVGSVHSHRDFFELPRPFITRLITRRLKLEG